MYISYYKNYMPSLSITGEKRLLKFGFYYPGVLSRCCFTYTNNSLPKKCYICSNILYNLNRIESNPRYTPEEITQISISLKPLH